MLSFECIKNEKSVYFLLTSAREGILVSKLGAETHGPDRGQKNEKSTARPRARKQDPRSPAAGGH